MRKKDWSLVVFTSLSQWSIGIVLCFTAMVFFHPEAAVSMNSGFSAGNPLVLALLLVGTATLVSFFHLGNPVNAPRALGNLASSWLSREILALGVYTLSLGAALVAGWFTGNDAVHGFLLALASVAGLLLLWTMVCVYLIPTVPPWNTGYTALGFASTTLCLGLASSVLLMGPGTPGTGRYSILLLAVLVLEWVSGYLLQRKLARMNTGINGPEFDRGVYRRAHQARMAALLFVCLAIIALAQNAGPGAEGGLLIAWYLLFLLVVAQEFTGRLMFYATYFRVGL